MELRLDRSPSASHATLGKLYINDVYECVTLEDVIRDLGPDGSGKVQDATAIPAGRYNVIIDWSPKFQRPMLHILAVPFFTGIRIHSGNDDGNTEGCVLVGQRVVGPDYIQGGSSALPILQNKISQALYNAKEDVYITINNPPEES